MNKRQLNAVGGLIAALRECNEAELTGGIYDSSFCVWPNGAPNPHECGGDFFIDGVEGKSGGVVINPRTHDMALDGGAGN